MGSKASATMAGLDRVGRPLGADDQEYLIAAFNMFDKDGSGRIDNSEFRSVCRELGIVPTEIELQMMIEEIDVDNSGDIDMHEFVSAISSKMVDPESEDHIRAAFSMFDNDGSGAWSTKSFMMCSFILGKICHQIKLIG